MVSVPFKMRGSRGVRIREARQCGTPPKLPFSVISFLVPYLGWSSTALSFLSSFCVTHKLTQTLQEWWSVWSNQVKYITDSIYMWSAFLGICASKNKDRLFYAFLNCDHHVKHLVPSKCKLFIMLETAHCLTQYIAIVSMNYITLNYVINIYWSFRTWTVSGAFSDYVQFVVAVFLDGFPDCPNHLL